MAEDRLLGMQLDEYRLEALLGHGGMARVYRGLDTRLQRYAAVKVIDTPLQTDSEYIQRFEQEAQVIAKLEHPHIVRLYRYGEAQGVLYMAMQYIEGTDLGVVLDSYRSDGDFIEQEDASRIIREICLALDYAHNKDVIHRDVKPSNIMLDMQGHAYLTDFGLALLTEMGTQGDVFGSPHYIAPEQAVSSAGAGPKSDLYSVGIILYEMMAGQLPFDAENPLDVAMMHMSADPRPPRSLRPDISPEIEAVILKAIAKEPENRYENGLALADALDNVITPREQASWQKTTMARRSVPEWVAVEMAENPLPPISAEVTQRPTHRVVEHSEHIDEPVVMENSEAEYPEPGSPFRQRSFQITCAASAAMGLLLLICVLIGFSLLRGDDDNDKGSGSVEGTVGTQAANAETLALDTITPSPFTFLAPTMTLAPSPTALVLAPNPTQFVLAPTVAGMAPEVSSGGTGYQLVVATHGEDSLFVINQTTDRALPLAPLQLGDGGGAISGSEWGVDALQPGSCVTAWKDGGNPESPNVSCARVGPDLTRDGPERFWKERSFNVYYNGALLGACGSESCTFTIAG